MKILSILLATGRRKGREKRRPRRGNIRALSAAMLDHAVTVASSLPSAAWPHARIYIGLQRAARPAGLVKAGDASLD
jgi:hypothetical protein